MPLAYPSPTKSVSGASLEPAATPLATARVGASPHAVSTPLPGGTAVLLHLTRQVYYELCPVGDRLWHHVARPEGTTAAALTRVLAALDGAPSYGMCARNVLDFLHVLHRADLIHTETSDRRRSVPPSHAPSNERPSPSLSSFS